MSRTSDRPADRSVRVPRRALFAAPIALLPISSHHRASGAATTISVSLNPVEPAARFDSRDISTVGIYDADWLLTPEFERMLDLMASSPGGISGVRFFGIFSSGATELLKPESGGTVWLNAEDRPDFTIPFAALEALTSRGLLPFIALGFFPPAISESPVVPPATFGGWQDLVSTFLIELANDARFGPDAIATWRFEVWNEPNEGRFWHGSFEEYLALYEATADAVRETGLKIRLGGPAMAYKPEAEAEDGPQTLRTFLEFLHANPDIQCDFISYHRKGTVDRSSPDPGRLWNASVEVERLVQDLAPELLPALELINNEADEKIGFESPYAPRMDAFAASWLTALASINALHAVSPHGAEPVRHLLFPDNANLQLMQEPFDGRRSIYVPVSDGDRSRLFKSAGAVWYDLLPFLDGDVLPVEMNGEQHVSSDVHIVATRSDAGCAVLVSWFAGDSVAMDSLRSLEFVLRNLPWALVNVIEYRIDGAHSNSFAAAGGSPENPVPVMTESDLRTVRLAQELEILHRFEAQVTPETGMLTLNLELEPFATALFWITEHDPQPIAPPEHVRVQAHGDDIDILWNAAPGAFVLGYEVERFNETGQREQLTRGPIRPLLVTDAPPPGDWSYRVRAVSSSNVASVWVTAEQRLEDAP